MQLINNILDQIPTHIYNGTTCVTISLVCEALGIRREGQYRKIYRNPQFTPSIYKTRANDGKMRNTTCIPKSELPMWICFVNASSVTVKYRLPLLNFQREMQKTMIRRLEWKTPQT